MFELLGAVPYSSSRMNPLNTVKWPIVIGFVLSVAVVALVNGGLASNTLTLASLTRWLHIISGVAWVGLLYYFNVVQTPAMAAAAADTGGPGGAGVNKYIAPRALLWFRWASLATWLMGAWLLSQTHGRFLGAFTLGWLDTPVSRPNMIMGIGAWLGTIMLLNVWGLIWPNQKKILGLKPVTDRQKATARKVALYASRTNFILSFPMLMCMIGPSHGLPF